MKFLTLQGVAAEHIRFDSVFSRSTGSHASHVTRLQCQVLDSRISSTHITLCQICQLTIDHPTHIHYIQGVAQIPSGFEQVKTFAFAPGQITLKSPTGQSVTVPVQHEFLMTGMLRQ